GIPEAFQPDELDELERPELRLGHVEPEDLGADQRIAQHRAPRQQLRSLEHEADVTPRPGDRAPVQQHVARRLPGKTAHDTQQSALAPASKARVPPCPPLTIATTSVCR